MIYKIKVFNMNYIWIIVIVLYVIFAHLIAQEIGTKRKIGYGKSVLWSILFSPIIGLLITLASNPIEKH
jgi:uncharacterized protein YqgC (DUF456 family)